MKKNLLLLCVSTLITLLGVELVLRILNLPPRFEGVSPPGHFWRFSPALGWDGKPGIEGRFANGYCLGHIRHDENGNRLNASEPTFEPGYRNVFFIGDSNTASYEVDDDETIPALLEQGLRERGTEVNVLNFGVRGYGTDQAVRKALLHAPRYQPEDVVYMYSDNDVFENNVLRRPGRRFGKGVYLARDGVHFEAHNYPVPRYRQGDYSAILLDDDGRPFVYQYEAKGLLRNGGDGWASRLGRGLEEQTRLFGALFQLKAALLPATKFEQKVRVWERRWVDPYEVSRNDENESVDAVFALYYATVDGGFERVEHGEYYGAQMEYLLGMLWSLPSVERVHLVEFPSDATLELMRQEKPSTNRRLFETLLAEGLLSRYVNLNLALDEDGRSIEELTCRMGDHFQARGNRWAASVLLERLELAAAGG